MIFWWCNAVSAESKLSPCQGEDHMKWTNCFGTYLKSFEKDVVTREYTGEFGSSPGKREGKGTAKIYKNGVLHSTHVGEYKNNKPHGQGTITHADGDKFVGEWKDGKRSGKGTITYANGDKFVGEYKNDLLNGKGIDTIYKNGILDNTFVAEYKDNEIIGKGTTTYETGDKFVVEYKNYLPHGQGTITYADGEKFVAEWKDGKIIGQGTHTYVNGDKLVVEYKDSKKNGVGIFTFANGGKEVAVFKDDEKVKIISSTKKKESSNYNFSNSSSTLSGYQHCKNIWVRLINIRDGYSKNSSDYYRLDALVQTAFDMWTTYKGTNAKDTGNCDKLLSLGSK